MAKESATAMSAGAVTDISGLGDIGSLMSQWQQFQQGSPGATQVSSQTYDLRGSGMRDEILAALQKHGIPTDGRSAIGVAGAIDEDPHDMMDLQGDILGILAKHGIDTGRLGIEQVPGAPRRPNRRRRRICLRSRTRSPEHVSRGRELTGRSAKEKGWGGAAGGRGSTRPAPQPTRR